MSKRFHTQSSICKLHAVRNEKGAFDLDSIMVGLIVLGIAGGIIAATVFTVIPWSQDRAAKAQLSAVETAENAYSGLSVASGGQEDFTELGTLVSEQLLTVEMLDGSSTVSANGLLCVTGSADKWQAWSASASGSTTFYASSAQSGALRDGDSGYVAVELDSCPGFQGTSNNPATGAESATGSGVTLGTTDGIPLLYDMDATSVEVVEGTLDLSTSWNTRLEGGTSHTYLTIDVKNVGGDANGFTLKLKRAVIPYILNNVTANDGRASVFQRDGEWFVQWTGNDYNKLGAGNTLSIQLDYTLQTIDGSHFTTTPGQVSSYAQTFTLKNESNFAANWVVDVDASALVNAYPGKTIVAGDGRYTVTQVSGSTYRVANVSDNYALPASGSREIILRAQ